MVNCISGLSLITTFDGAAVEGEGVVHRVAVRVDHHAHVVTVELFL